MRDSPAINLLSLVMRFVQLSASIRNGKQSNLSLIIEEILLLDSELEVWEENLPVEWHYSVPPAVSHSNSSLYGSYHQYQDLRTAQMYNHYRWSRIMVNDLFLAFVIKCRLVEHSSKIRKCLSTISRIAEDTCSSISSLNERQNMERLTYRESGLLSRIFPMMWPLAVAGGGAGVSTKLYEWVLKTLENLWVTMGIQHARILVFFVKTQRQRWKQGMASRLAIQESAALGQPLEV